MEHDLLAIGNITQIGSSPALANLSCRDFNTICHQYWS